MKVKPHLIVLIAVLLTISGGCRQSKTEPSVEATKEAASEDNLAPHTAGTATQQDTRPPVVFPEFKAPAASMTGYTGSTACQKCHEEVYRRYQSHPMANSLAPVADVDSPVVMGKASEFNPHKGVTCWADLDKSNQMFHAEKRVDSSGKTIFEQHVAVHFSVGSGSHGRSYLIQEGGRLSTSLLSWYSEKQRWDLSPGYQATGNPRFERQVSEACLACHAGRVTVENNKRDTFPRNPFLEHSIGCENCHGPGQSHIAFHEGDQTPTAEDPLLQLTSLSADLQDAVCLQCHLQGERRVLRYGRGAFSFRPGMAISDVWVTFLKSPAKDQSVQIVSQNEQMHSSKCYNASNQEMKCTTCHDPHFSPVGQQVALHYNSRCSTCHVGPDTTACTESMEFRKATTPADSCIECHMPSLPIEDVPHTAHTDHRILRSKNHSRKTRDVSDDLIEESRNMVFTDGQNQIPQHEVDRARGIFLAETAYSSDKPALAIEAMALLYPAMHEISGDIETAEAAGRAAVAGGNLKAAISAWDTALKKHPDDEGLLLLRATILHDMNRWNEAADTYSGLIKVNPHRSIYHGRYAHVLGRLGRWEDGIRAAQKALEINPSLIQAHMWLSQVYQQTGNPEQSQHHRNLGDRLIFSIR